MVRNPSNTGAGKEMNDGYPGNQTGRSAREEKGRAGPVDDSKTSNTNSLVVAPFKAHAGMAASSKVEVSVAETEASADRKADVAGRGVLGPDDRLSSAPDVARQVLGPVTHHLTKAGVSTGGGHAGNQTGGKTQEGEGRAGHVDGSKTSNTDSLVAPFKDYAGNPPSSKMEVYAGSSSSNVNRQVLRPLQYPSSKAAAATANNEMAVNGRAGDRAGGKGKGKERKLERGRESLKVGGEVKGRGDRPAKVNDKVIAGDSDDDFYSSNVAPSYEASIDFLLRVPVPSESTEPRDIRRRKFGKRQRREQSGRL